VGAAVRSSVGRVRVVAGVSKFHVGQRVRCLDGNPENGLHAGETYVIRGDDGDPYCGLLYFVCGLDEGFFGWRFKPVADEQPGAVQPTYEQRREEIARRRNPGVIITGTRTVSAWDIGRGDYTVYATQDADGFWSFTSWNDKPDTCGVARAVARLSEREPRLGCHAWRP
jgi:hypothetical protein